MRADGEAGDGPLRIIHVFRAPLGGLFRHVLDVTRGQIAAGHAVGIICDSTTGGSRADAALAELAPDLALGLRRIAISRGPNLRDIGALQQVRSFCRAARPDVIHGHGSKGGVFARLAVLSGPKPVRAYTPHGGSFNYFPGSATHAVYMRVETILAGATDVFLAESEFIAGRIRAAVGPSRAPVQVVHNGIAESEFEPIIRDAAPFDLLYLGELRFAKGIDTLLAALAALGRAGIRPTLLLVGSGPEEEALRARVIALGLCAQATFAPAGPIRAALARARLMVVPSRAESLPYVVLEAAGAAQPLIATDVGGIPEIFGPQKHRLIPCDDVAILSDAIRSALDRSEADLAQEAAALAAFVRANFSLPAMVTAILDAYRRAMASSPGKVSAIG